MRFNALRKRCGHRGGGSWRTRTPGVSSGNPVLRAMLAHWRAADAALRIFDHLWGGLHAHIALRVRYVDDACEAAIAAGIGQLVLLGAGFDTTSIRRAGTPVTIFEVDAPTTQAHKRPVVERLLAPRHSCRIHWVACDLERNALREALLAAGFDPKQPALVVWLGVTPYLTRGAIDATIADLAGLCTPGVASSWTTSPRASSPPAPRGRARAGSPGWWPGAANRIAATSPRPTLTATLASARIRAARPRDRAALLRRYDPVARKPARGRRLARRRDGRTRMRRAPTAR
ncbi:class I SAM-dependent methyltransferase [Mycobacterium intracellulare]|uniref:class I SAM-dependent methyltransferase n=1 Tax=Mycobacterium intracellulare TaxID=1767 RepID=UPI001E4F991B|nr:class I SAM-dependent methyltransferase [Mycobacterium intracellulare]